ncbi:M48 family metalloprotease [Bradyrhizobium sp. Gha]|uniref:M48 family metalloprotease n=1 Tax=Bradyrhizobium sp. Gha TaxID=1855318 RepID=UPI0008E6C428|nr:M48 family metalloprotease [Bradyrhizobium sp. Gha]SFH64324.1 Zn-dependent protease with chaperone function [Bradyrhizobium sp. Gha]
MAVHGYITHAAHNRRWTALLVLGYVLAFEVIGAFVLTMGLLYWDHEHTILTDPAGYALRYAAPIAVVAGLVFWRIYRGHAKAVTQALNVRIVTRQDEPRFVQIAEEQCTALGVRLPRFGIIEVSEPNAVTAGEGPTKGLIAVTRGLLDRLDDDELAAVLAHEASHIRHGDTRLLAANHALMRTAVILHVNNPLRLEDWRQVVLVVLVPPMLLLLLVSSALTSFSMQLSRAARRGLKLGRDHIADGEAIRVTHFPEALLSAITKIGGRGAFAGSERVEGMLFDGRADHEGGTHPAIADRLDAIRSLGGELLNPARQRLDTRVSTQPVFGRRTREFAAATAYPRHASGVPLERPRPPSPFPLLLCFTDRDLFMQWQNACETWAEAQLNERHILGVMPKMMIPLGLAFAAMLFIYWPKDGNLSRLAEVMNPVRIVDLMRQVNSGPPAGVFKQIGQKDASAPPAGQSSFGGSHSSEQNGHLPTEPSGFLRVLVLGLVALAIFKRKLYRRFFGKLFGHAESHEIDRSKPRWADVSEAELIARSEQLARGEQLKWRAQPPPNAAHSAPVFGRRRV